MMTSWPPGKDACHGDSGGALWRWQKVGGGHHHVRGRCRAVQVGIIARGQECARVNRPAIFTNVSAHARFILDNISDDGGCEEDEEPF